MILFVCSASPRTHTPPALYPPYPVPVCTPCNVEIHTPLHCIYSGIKLKNSGTFVTQSLDTSLTSPTIKPNYFAFSSPTQVCHLQIYAKSGLSSPVYSGGSVCLPPSSSDTESYDPLQTCFSTKSDGRFLQTVNSLDPAVHFPPVQPFSHCHELKTC